MYSNFNYVYKKQTGRNYTKTLTSIYWGGCMGDFKFLYTLFSKLSTKIIYILKPEKIKNLNKFKISLNTM